MSITIGITDIQKAECFSALFQHIRLFTEQINIMLESGRMYIQSMDSARVSIFEIFIPSTWFDVYQHTNVGSTTIGLNSTMLFKILNTRDKLQEISIVFNEDDPDKLFLNLTCDNKSIFDKHFELPLLDLDYELMNIPHIESQAELSISSTNFASIINQLKLFGDSLDIECNEENILLTSVSQESGKMLVKIDIDDLTSYAINEGENMKISFSLNNLHNICMYNKIAKEIEIHLTKNYPMKIIYNLGDDTKLVFYLAPKIDDSD